MGMVSPLRRHLQSERLVMLILMLLWAQRRRALLTRSLPFPRTKRMHDLEYKLNNVQNSLKKRNSLLRSLKKHPRNPKLLKR
jgi:hypothetical protein